MRELKRDLETFTGEFLASEVKLLSEQRKIALRRNLGETEAICEYCGAKLPYMAYLFEGRVVTVLAEPVRCDCEKAQAYWAEQDAKEKAKEEKPDKKKEISIEDLWTYACSGDVENLKAYYESGGTANRRYYKFGVYHSLIAGAYRNGYYDVVSFLLDNGETITKEEHREIDIHKVYMDEFLQTVDNVISYFKYHNKNLSRVKETNHGIAHAGSKKAHCRV